MIRLFCPTSLHSSRMIILHIGAIFSQFLAVSLNAVIIHIALKTISSRTVRVQMDTLEMATIAQVRLLLYSMGNG